MNVCRILSYLFFASTFLVVNAVCAEDVVQLKTGTKVLGKVTSYDLETIKIDVKIGARTVSRTYPTSKVKSLTVEGSEVDLTTALPVSGGTSPASADRPTRSEREILADIDRIGKTPPDWYDSTPLSYPETLDLSWPEKPPGGWDSSKNVGQYIWDRINPNENQWRGGVKFMHHILATTKDANVRQRSMLALATMYHNLHQDYARAAFWYQQAGIAANSSNNVHGGLNLANCYWQLGNKAMGLATLKGMTRVPYGAIKLLGDMGETADAIKMAEQFSKTGDASVAYLYAGDACRVAGRLQEAETYYRKSIVNIDPANADKGNVKRDKSRAEASIAAIRFFTLDPTKVKDGTYTAGSIGYEAEVKVEVSVKAGRIENVRVVQHREKQFYSSIQETPRKILNRQSVNGIDATTGATITSEAIINATATALSRGL